VVVLFAAAVGALVVLQEPDATRLRVGTEVPRFTLPDLEGRPVAVPDLEGRVTFVNFWGTWCPPCREEAPALERLYQSLRAEGFEVLAVSIDDPGSEQKVAAFKDEFGLSFPILLDDQKEAYRAFGATGVPETFLIDATGRLHERFIGPRDWDNPRYARAVRRLLAVRGEDGAS
jgi:peroxiredoxin